MEKYWIIEPQRRRERRGKRKEELVGKIDEFWRCYKVC
jgi:hypothetical protein